MEKSSQDHFNFHGNSLENLDFLFQRRMSLTWVVLDDVAKRLECHLDTLEPGEVGGRHLLLLEGHERVEVLGLRPQVVQEVYRETLRILKYMGRDIRGLFVCGISLTSGQLFNELFPDCTISSQPESDIITYTTV